MPFDGTVWDETTPTNSDLVNEGDDNIRDIKQGVRGRMAQEHVWPTSQSATNQAGIHKYITFQTQTSTPALVVGSNTQIGALFMSTNKHLSWEDSAGSVYVIAQSGIGVSGTLFSGSGTLGSLVAVTSGGTVVQIAPATTNSVIAGNGSTAMPSYKTLASILVVTSGQAAHGATVSLPSGVNSNEVQAIMVSVADLSSAIGTSNPDGITHACSINASRVVTCTWTGVNGGSPTGTGTANYVLIGIVTH